MKPQLRFRQHIPTFVTGPTPFELSGPLDEILNHEFFQNLKKRGFWGFSYSDWEVEENKTTFMLMAEYNNRHEWWVVGYVSCNEYIPVKDLGLPRWEPKK